MERATTQKLPLLRLPEKGGGCRELGGAVSTKNLRAKHEKGGTEIIILIFSFCQG